MIPTPFFCSALKAKRCYVDRLSSNPKVGFVWKSEVDAILGDQAVTAIRLRNRKDGRVTERPCVAVFPFIGTLPSSRFMPQELLDSDGYAETDAAAGAVRRCYGGQPAQAIGDGVSAATMALKTL